MKPLRSGAFWRLLATGKQTALRLPEDLECTVLASATDDGTATVGDALPELGFGEPTVERGTRKCPKRPMRRRQEDSQLRAPPRARMGDLAGHSSPFSRRSRRSVRWSARHNVRPAGRPHILPRIDARSRRPVTTADVQPGANESSPEQGRIVSAAGPPARAGGHDELLAGLAASSDEQLK